MRTLVAALAAVAAGILTPFAACDELAPSFRYGEPEMRAAVEGTWQLTAGAQTITFTMKQASASEREHASRGLVRSAAACGQRSFVRTAGACIDETEMPLVIAVRGATGTGTGDFMVIGTSFAAGRLSAHVDTMRIFADLAPDGRAANVEVYSTDPAPTVVKLVRIAR